MTTQTPISKPENAAPTEDVVGVDVPRLVRLVMCGRRSCSHVLIEEERDWREDPDWKGHRTAVCPKCGDDSFYHLNEAGQKINFSDREKYRNGIDPATIEPSPKMGLKMKRRILRAKRHALSLANH
ncbi:MAG: hypothetical protein ABIT37_16280 [Luteolibacter sp.]